MQQLSSDDGLLLSALSKDLPNLKLFQKQEKTIIYAIENKYNY